VIIAGFFMFKSNHFMIKVNELTYSYPGAPGRDILCGISMEIREGEKIAIMGANGSGKTTFVRCLNGLLIPDKGEVVVDELDTRSGESVAEVRRRVGMVFQNPENQIVSTTVEREIAFGPENLGIPSPQIAGIIEQMLDLFDLAEYRQQPPHLLSGGEIQRLALASVLAMSPKYVIFDESTSLLDPKSRNDIISLVLNLADSAQSSSPVTPVWVTQFAEETLLFERLLIFSAGSIVFDGKPSEVMKNVEQLHDLGIDAPLEYEVSDYLKKTSNGKILLNPSEILPIN
jgi:energy-coupling factor transport system ATP-binding protein